MKSSKSYGTVTEPLWQTLAGCLFLAALVALSLIFF
jgi:hypothetical protein